MKRLIAMVGLILCLALPVGAVEFEAPAAPESVAEAVEEKADTFAEGLWNVICAAVEVLNPSLTEAGQVAVRVAGAVMLCGLVRQLGGKGQTVDLVSTVCVGAALLEPASSLIRLGVETVMELRDYGKLLLPVMTGAMAAQGGFTASSAMYAGTALFDSVLSAAMSSLLVPMLWLFLALSIANGAFREPILGKLRNFIKWSMTWTLKLGLYIFTGYLAVTGVVSGTADAAAVKAAKLTISGAVPVVGGILSDASEAVLNGVGVLRSGVGVYGLLTLIALFLTPFLRIGVQYLLLKGVSFLCEGIEGGRAAELISDFAGAMGLVLAMVGTQTVFLLISTVCFMKGVS